MTLYNVHIYREMRLAFEGIKAESHEEAAAIARDKLTVDADAIDDCEGVTLAALVDVAGDEQYEQSRIIDFETQRLLNAAPVMLESLRRAEFLMRRVSDGDHRALENLRKRSGPGPRRHHTGKCLSLNLPASGDRESCVHCGCTRSFRDRTRYRRRQGPRARSGRWKVRRGRHPDRRRCRRRCVPKGRLRDGRHDICLRW